MLKLAAQGIINMKFEGEGMQGAIFIFFIRSHLIYHRREFATPTFLGIKCTCGLFC